MIAAAETPSAQPPQSPEQNAGNCAADAPYPRANPQLLLRKLAEVVARLADDAGRSVDAGDIRDMLRRLT